MKQIGRRSTSNGERLFHFLCGVASGTEISVVFKVSSDSLTRQVEEWTAPRQTPRAVSDPIHRELWALSLQKNLPPIECGTCREYLDGVEKFSSGVLDDKAEAVLSHTPAFLVVRTFLHPSSPLFSKVFGPTVRGQLSGRCKSCGRSFRYAEHPRGDEPGELSIGKSEPGAPPQAVREEAVSQSPQKSKTAASSASLGLETNPEPGVLWWRPSQEGGSLARLRTTANSIWYDQSFPDGVMGQRISTTFCIDSESGETVSRCQYSQILDSDRGVVLTQSGRSKSKLCIQEETTANCVWQQPFEEGVWGLTEGKAVHQRSRGKRLRWFGTKSESSQWRELSGSEGTVKFVASDNIVLSISRDERGRAWSLPLAELIWVSEKPIQGVSDLFLDKENWIFSDSSGTTLFDSHGNNRRHLEMFQTVVLYPDWILGEWNQNSDQEAWCRVPRKLGLLKRPNGELRNLRQVDDSASPQNAIYDQKLWYLEYPRQLAVIDLKSKGKTVRELPHCLKEVRANDISLTALSSGVLLYTKRGDVLRLDCDWFEPVVLL